MVTNQELTAMYISINLNYIQVLTVNTNEIPG